MFGKEQIAILLAAALALGGAYFKGRHDASVADELKITQAEVKALKSQNEAQEKINAAEAKHATEIDGISARLRTALGQLRNRPGRLPEAAKASCAGASGAELSGPDAEFLVGEAARADRIRAALKLCYEEQDITGGSQ